MSMPGWSKTVTEVPVDGEYRRRKVDVWSRQRSDTVATIWLSRWLGEVSFAYCVQALVTGYGVRREVRSSKPTLRAAQRTCDYWMYDFLSGGEKHDLATR